MIYEHGRFGPHDTAATAEALGLYALGLYAYSGVKVLAPAFYALDDARVPVTGSFLGMAANVALNLALWPVLGFRGVALGTAAAAWVNFAVMVVGWQRRHGGLAGTGLVRQLVRVCAATAVLALAAWLVHQGLDQALPPGRSLARQLVLGLAPVAAGGLAYLAAARALGIGELAELVGVLGRRRRR
jgi:putative peptidoglycan lipid II flippase